MGRCKSHLYDLFIVLAYLQLNLLLNLKKFGLKLTHENQESYCMILKQYSLVGSRHTTSIGQSIGHDFTGLKLFSEPWLTKFS